MNWTFEIGISRSTDMFGMLAILYYTLVLQ